MTEKGKNASLIMDPENLGHPKAHLCLIFSAM